MCGPSVQKAVRRLWKKQSFSFYIYIYIYIHVIHCIIRRCLFTLSFHENWVLNCCSVTSYGEGKRRNEGMSLRNVKCNICRMTQRNKLNWKVRLFWRQSICKRSRCFFILTYDDNQKATKAHCRLPFSAQSQRFFLPLLVGLHGSTDTTARKSAIIEEKMFWKVTLASTLIFSAKMFARLTLQFLFTYICICNRLRGVSFSNGGLRDCDIIFRDETDLAHVFCFFSCNPFS